MTMLGHAQDRITKCGQLISFSKHIFTIAAMVLKAAEKLMD